MEEPHSQFAFQPAQSLRHRRLSYAQRGRRAADSLVLDNREKVLHLSKFHSSALRRGSRSSGRHFGCRGDESSRCWRLLTGAIDQTDVSGQRWIE